MHEYSDSYFDSKTGISCVYSTGQDTVNGEIVDGDFLEIVLPDGTSTEVAAYYPSEQEMIDMIKIDQAIDDLEYLEPDFMDKLRFEVNHYFEDHQEEWQKELFPILMSKMKEAMKGNKDALEALDRMFSDED